MPKIRQAGLALALCAPLLAHAQSQSPITTAADIAALQKEIQALRASHEARLQALEQRLKAALDAVEPAAALAAPSPPSSPPPPVMAARAPAAAASAFNPAMSLILSGGYQRSTQDPATYRIRGSTLPADAEVGPGTRGFSLAESELGLAASVDPWWRGVANIALHPDNAVSVDEAYVQTTALGQGLTLKAGRFLSAVGYLNSQHSHTWDFADNPLAYQALLGTQYGDDGLQLQWLAPTDTYLAVHAELGRGRGFPGSDSGRNVAGMTALAVHSGGDWGDSHSWRAGLSVLNAKADKLAWVAGGAGQPELVQAFSGTSRVWVADAVWKWAPNGNAARTNFKLQGEFLRSTRSGSVADEGGATGTYRAVQSGWYLQGIYQFMPAWRVGLRTERLNMGTVDDATQAAGSLATGLRQPAKHSLMLDYSPSEFSRLRLQLAQDRARADAPGTGADRQITLQYQMSLGAHGAHSY